MLHSVSQANTCESIIFQILDSIGLIKEYRSNQAGARGGGHLVSTIPGCVY